jgi:hypothetical protein
VTARSLLVAAIATLTSAGCAAREPTPRPVERPPQVLRPAPVFSPVDVTGAMREAPLFVEDLPAIGARLEIRTIVVKPDTVAVLPTAHEAVLELRSGDIETTTDGTRQARRLGEMWIVAPGSRVEIKVAGQLAVLRVVYLIKSER